MYATKWGRWLRSAESVGFFPSWGPSRIGARIGTTGDAPPCLCAREESGGQGGCLIIQAVDGGGTELRGREVRF